MQVATGPVLFVIDKKNYLVLEYYCNIWPVLSDVKKINYASCYVT